MIDGNSSLKELLKALDDAIYPKVSLALPGLRIYTRFIWILILYAEQQPQIPNGHKSRRL
jgi:hypothetical protein